MNNFFKAVFVFLLTVTFFSCLEQKKIVSALQSANQLYYERDYNAALENYSQVIDYYVNKGQQPSGELLSAAGKCHYYLGSKQRAMEYFKSAKEHDFADEQTTLLMIQYYESVDDTAMIIKCLEDYASDYPSGEEIASVREKIFLKYFELKDYRKCFYAFNSLLSETTDKIDILEKYYTAAKNFGNVKKAEETAQKLYNRDPNNLIGLSFMAQKTFHEVEDEYQEALKVYNAKKNNTTLKVFKKKQEELKPKYTLAKAYYTRLYKLYGRKEDAADLSVISLRLNEKKNSDYYLKLSKKK
ncbi:MAG: hypothetical protein II937_11475 [Bacteroidales bacterium]|nr:hypothetical protein [Bacteroidales bacterium]